MNGSDSTPDRNGGFPDARDLAYSPAADRRDGETTAARKSRLGADTPTASETRLLAARFIEAVGQARDGDDDAGQRVQEIAGLIPAPALAVAVALIAARYADAAETLLAEARPDDASGITGRTGSARGWLLRDSIAAVTRSMLARPAAPGHRKNGENQ